MTELPDLSQLTHDEKDALIRALRAQVQVLTARVAELEAKLAGPPTTPGNSSLPPSRGKKPNRAEKAPRCGPRPGSLDRMGGKRPLTETRDEVVSASEADPTSTARSKATPRSGRSAWPINSVTAPTPSRPATPCSRRA